MELLSGDRVCSSGLLATMLLDAWLSGDRCRLLWELDRVASWSPVSGDGAESDRMEILTSIVSEMRAQSDLFAPRTANTRIGVWMDLLDHLSDPGNTVIN
jgi:hypothetical protein